MGVHSSSFGWQPDVFLLFVGFARGNPRFLAGFLLNYGQTCSRATRKYATGFPRVLFRFYRIDQLFWLNPIPRKVQFAALCQRQNGKIANTRRVYRHNPF